MNRIEGVDGDELRAALADADDPKAVKRLMVALAYDDGVAVDVLADRYGIPRSTLYSWLSRFEDEPLPEAVRDDSRPGRPPELADAERRQFAEALADPPADHGFEAGEWTPRLARRYLRREFRVEYSLGHVRRLLREHGDCGR